jgi:MFS family permease
MLKEIYYLIKDRTLFYFSLSSGFSTFAYSLLVSYFPVIINLFNISTFIIGTIYSTINFLYEILNIPLGIIVDKIGSKNALVISVVYFMFKWILIFSVLIIFVSSLFYELHLIYQSSSSIVYNNCKNIASSTVYGNINETVVLRFNGVNYCVFIYLTDNRQ